MVMTTIKYKLPDGMSREVISVASGQMFRPVRHIEMSVRMRHALESADIRLIGELSGRTYGQFMKLKNVGAKTALELKDIVGRLNADPHAAWPGEPEAQVKSERLHTAYIMRDIELSHFPMSPRLRSILTKAGYKTVGDLNCVAFRDILRLRNCGPKSLRELLDILHGPELPPPSSLRQSVAKGVR